MHPNLIIQKINEQKREPLVTPSSFLITLALFHQASVAQRLHPDKQQHQHLKRATREGEANTRGHHPTTILKI